jgi:hypothetical protein
MRSLYSRKELKRLLICLGSERITILHGKRRKDIIRLLFNEAWKAAMPNDFNIKRRSRRIMGNSSEMFGTFRLAA